MARYGWKDNYIEHNRRYDKEFLPYARWVEILDVIEEDEIRKQYEAWEKTAMIGFQNYLISPHRTKPYLNFSQWMDSLGIKAPNVKKGSRLTKQQEIDKAHKQLTEMGFGDILGTFQTNS